MLPSSEQRPIKAVADARPRNRTMLPNLKPRLPSAQPSRHRAVAAGTAARSACADGYRVAYYKYPASWQELSWQEGVVNQEDLLEKLSVAEQKAVIDAAKAASTGQASEAIILLPDGAQGLGQHGLVAAWAVGLTLMI